MNKELISFYFKILKGIKPYVTTRRYFSNSPLASTQTILLVRTGILTKFPDPQQQNHYAASLASQ